MYSKIFMLFFLIGISSFLLHKAYAPTATITKAAEPISTEPKILLNTPSLDQIFAFDHSWVATLSAERTRTLLVTGDVIPARVVNIQTTKFNNFLWPFEKTADIVKNADVTFIDLEAPIITDCPLSNEGFKFCGNAKHVEGLVYAGVDIANLANNHIGNYGEEAITETISHLQANSIAVTGQHKPFYKNVRGMTFAFLGYNDIGYTPESIADAEEKAIQAEVTEARKNADVVVVQYHWGTEYQNQPDERQKYLGKFAVDAGADLVIGNHPHWIQPIEVYKDKLITYAHGNFIFDQEWSLKTKQGVIGKYTYLDDQLVDVEYFPIQIEFFGQPYLLSGEKKEIILKDMKNESSVL